MTILVICALAGAVPVLWPPRRPRLPFAWSARPRGAAHSSLPSPSSSSALRSSVRSGIASRWRGGGPAVTARHDVADALVLVALCLRAGLPLEDALQQVGRGAQGSVDTELAAVVAALRWGLPSARAWEFAGPHWRPAAAASQLSERTGAAAADLLESAAGRMREQADRASERAAARAGVLLVLPLGLGFLPAFACTAVIPLVATLAGTVLVSAP